MALQPHDILRKRYEIVGLIGTGGMGAVYLAHDTRLTGRQCAVKESQFSLTLKPEILEAARKQFYQEASTLAQLDHPVLPKVSDYFSLDERDYLVMDYVPGKNLQEIIRQTKQENLFLEETTVLAWAEQICSALDYLHNRQPAVLHRDIKPANIKLTPDNRIKLVDFGLAKPLDPDDPSTITGFQGMGSLPYAPLEQYLDHLGHTSPRSDLYALGATLYHLLTNRVPASAQERFLDATMLPSPETINPNVSKIMRQAIQQAMAPHPKDRPASIAEWQKQLKPLTIASQPMISYDTTLNETAFNKQLLFDNQWLIGIMIGLLLLAIWMTFG